MKKYPAAVQFSLYIAIVSFVTAITIFACYFFSGDDGFAFIGFFAALLFGVVNVIALIVLGIAVKIGAAERKDAFLALLMQLANIPVAVLLFWAGAHLMSIARVTFVNETGDELYNVRILGCEERMIDQLDIGESELLWIRISAQRLRHQH